MVGKLMKHEFLRTRSVLGLSAAATLLIVVAGYGLSLFTPFVAGFPFFIGFIVSCAYVFAVQLYLAIDLYRSSFGRRGYFTHTLPIKGSTLLWTKFGYAMLVTLAAIVWTVVLLLITLATADRLGFFTFGQLRVSLDLLIGSAPWLIWFVVLNIVGLLVATLAQYYFCVTIGSEAWLNKTGGLGPVVVFVVFYFVYQIVGVLALLIPPSFLPGSSTWTWGPPMVDMINDPSSAGIPLSVFWVTYLVSALLMWRAVKSVSKKLELR